MSLFIQEKVFSKDQMGKSMCLTGGENIQEDGFN
jgi:hypothetical protein